jgi:hypothetical protein
MNHLPFEPAIFFLNFGGRDWQLKMHVHHIFPVVYMIAVH